VEAKHRKKDDAPTPERLDVALIVVAKRLGFSLQELNEFRVSDLLDIAGYYSGDKEDDVRMATQADFDKF
jgi:hypothetical protein